MLQTANAVTQTPIPVRRPIRWANPSPGELTRWVREALADDEENLVLSRHAAEDRLSQRGFTVLDVMTVLQKGYAYRAEKGSFPGEHKVNFALTLRGREAAVATLVNPSTQQIIVLTVMWADRTFYKP